MLGLEFIVAADLIGTTTTPDYYSLGIVAGIVAIRTLLNYSLNRELTALSKEKIISRIPPAMLSIYSLSFFAARSQHFFSLRKRRLLLM